MDKLECKFDELAKLRMSLISWISWTVNLDGLDKLDSKFDELDKLRMSSMS